MREMVLLLLTLTAAQAAEELLPNPDFAGQWRPNTSAWEAATAEGEVPTGWEDISTWSGASTRYTRIDGPDGAGLRLELVSVAEPTSVLQLRSAADLTLEAGQTYAVSAMLRSPTDALVELALRQHQEPRIRFWQTMLRPGPEWRPYRFVVAPTESGPTRFFLSFREPGAVDVAALSVQRPDPAEVPPPRPPVPVETVRCVATRGDLLRYSDVIAMYQEGDLRLLRDYFVDVVAWGGQLSATPEAIAQRRELIERATAMGIRLHAVDCALVQEGGRCVVAGAERGSPTTGLFSELRRDNAGALAQLADAGIDLTDRSVLDVEGNWLPVPWLRNRWRIPLASVYDESVRQWYRDQMDAIAATGATALHFDEPGMGAYGLQHPEPGDFSPEAMATFREWLRRRPESVWREAGVESLDGFDYGAFVTAHGGDPRRAPLWREFLRFPLFTPTNLVHELHDRVRAQVDHPVPLSMNANASSWIKLPFLSIQDYMTTEVPHLAKSRQVPDPPLLVYKLGDAIGQPVASTAMGHDWYEMKTDQHPVLVSSWVAMGYALGHHPMIPVKAWVMDPVKGSDMYRPDSEHYRCLAGFIKQSARLLDGYAPVSTVAVVVGADAIEREEAALVELAARLAAEQIPYHMVIEGNDLLPRELTAADLAGTSAVLLASPHLLPSAAVQRVEALAAPRPIVDHSGAALPSVLPRPIAIDGAERLWALPRMKPGDESAPAVIHLLNRRYDADRRDMLPTGPFALTLDPALFGGRTLTAATLHQPKLTAEFPADGAVTVTQPLLVRTEAGRLRIEVPGVAMWGLVELE